jgi:glycosyltransferase involved in cell wall biosynthesis
MKEPIRILQVVTVMNLGGIENFLMTLYRNIDKTKIQFDFLVHRHEVGAFDDEIRELGGKIYKMDPLSPLKYFTYRNKLKHFFHGHPEFKIVHSHINANSALVLSVAKSMGVPVRIAHAHIDTTGGNNKQFKNFLRKLLKNYTTQNFACSKSAGKWLYGQGKFEVFNNSIDTRKFEFRNYDVRNRVRKALNIGKDEIIIGNIARFSEQKNHRFLINIFNEYVKLNSRVKLLLVGDGELKSSICNQIEELGLKDKVIFTGAVKNSNDYLNAMDIFLFPSFYEGLPVVLVETQCNGVPILLTNTISKEIELTDLINRKSLESSAKEWADEIQSIIEKYNTNDRSKYIQDIKINNYDINSNVIELEKFYLAKSII